MSINPLKTRRGRLTTFSLLYLSEGIPFGFSAIALTYSFTSGLIQGTRTALFMGLTNPKVAATQFTGYMALNNMVYTYSSLWQGRFADVNGYASTMYLDCALVIVPLLIIPLLLPSTRGND